MSVCLSVGSFCTLTCVSLSGGAAATFDALALGGAFSVGYANDSHAEFGYTTTSGTTRSSYAEDGNWKRTVINLAQTGQWATNTISALIDSAVSNVRNGRFVLRGKLNIPRGESGAPMRVELLVNGVSAGSHTFLGDGLAYEDAVYDIPAGTLTEGMNTFALVNRSSVDGFAGGTGCYISMDCRYFEFEPDPAGTVLFLR